MLNAHVLFSKARHGRIKECVALLDKGVDASDDAGNSMLIIAAQNNHKKIAKEALRRNCDMHHQNHKGNTCLHYAFGYKYAELGTYLISKGYEELGTYLISKGCDDTHRNIYNRTCYDGLAETGLAQDMELGTAYHTALAETGFA
ncbi:ankyrin repeat-containing domain protein [Baffinella frigidus]|nr:ankyrin repeat-containing domain protein [Cryptophyta sp. CCMP2293]